MTCSDCTHYVAQTATQGLCRRYPPVPYPPFNSPEQGRSYFPVVLAAIHCGEHDPIQAFIPLISQAPVVTEVEAQFTPEPKPEPVAAPVTRFKWWK